MRPQKGEERGVTRNNGALDSNYGHISRDKRYTVVYSSLFDTGGKGVKMTNYKYCHNCGIQTPFHYNFESLTWECIICGKELAKPEDRVWEKREVKNKKLYKGV